MIPSEPQVTEVEAAIVGLPLNVKKHLYFNRYHVEKCGDVVLCQFVFWHQEMRQPLDHYTFSISLKNLEKQAGNIGTYLSAIGSSDAAEPISDSNFITPTTIDNAAVLQLTKIDDNAEIGIVNYSLKHFVNQALPNDDRYALFMKVVAKLYDDALKELVSLKSLEQQKNRPLILGDTLALLSSTPALHKRFLLELMKMVT